MKFTKMILAIVVLAMMGMTTSASAATYIKMRFAGAATFFLSESTHTLYMTADGDKEVQALDFVKKDQFGNDVFLSRDKTQFFLMNSNSKEQYIYMAGIDTRTAQKNFEFKLDKRYVEEVNF